MENPTDAFMAGLPETLRGGDADSVSCAISALRLIDGTILVPPAPGVTAIVGPNNAGKSTLLREVHAATGLEPNQVLTLPRVVNSIELRARRSITASYGIT